MNDQWSVVVLHFGYAESSCVSPMIFANTHGEWPPTKLDALRDVATWFMKKWILDHEWGETQELEECCQKARAEKKPPRFCPDCGEATAKKPDFDVDDYRSWMTSCQARTANGFGWDGLSEEPWSCWNQFQEVILADRIVEIEENAEDVLTYALQPENLPDGIAEAIRIYREEVVRNHPKNRLDKAGFDADQLADFDAKVRSRQKAERPQGSPAGVQGELETGPTS